jgi:hypothetical protein
MPRADSNASAGLSEPPSPLGAGTPIPGEAARPGEVQNFVIMAAYQVLMRTGWIFKTESTIMPAVADVLAGGNAGWIRGWLPFFNRFGQSIPPLLAARQIKIQPRKKWAFVVTTTCMATTFLGLTSIWLIPGLKDSSAAPLLYLLLYALFFMAIGVNQLTYNTLQGKLIRPTYRGRLLMVADVIGATTAVVCALTLLPLWLPDDRGTAIEGSPLPEANFAAIFGFSTALFWIASGMSWLLREEPDHQEESRRGVTDVFIGAWTTLRDDPNFRRTATVAALFSTSLVLFPHYQAVARDELNMGMRSLMWFLVAQNIGTGVFSVLTGPLADRFGNRLAIRVVTLLICGGPLLAMALIDAGATGQTLFPLVFAMIGLTPVAQKTFNNYTLELTTPENHPRYLSTLNLCMAAPIFLSPVVGALTSTIGFEAVYYGVTGLLLTGWLLSFRLAEPRHGPIRLRGSELE